MWQDIAVQMEKTIVRVHHGDAQVPKSQANKEHWNNELADQVPPVKASQVDLGWQHKGELFLTPWAHDASGHQDRDFTSKWAQGQGVDLTMDAISQVTHECETCCR